jgi:hypothetical protein
MPSEEDDNLYIWANNRKAPANPSPFYEAVLIAEIELPRTIRGHCFGLMLADRAEVGGNIFTTLHSFPRGERKKLGYIRLWEPPDLVRGVHVRPIVSIRSITETMRLEAQQRRRLFTAPGEVDIAVLVGDPNAPLQETEGISEIKARESGQIQIFKDLATVKRTALNLVTGEWVPFVGEQELDTPGFGLRALAVPFVRSHQGVPYLHNDGLITISKGEAALRLTTNPNDPNPQVASLTIGMTLRLQLE